MKKLNHFLKWNGKKIYELASTDFRIQASFRVVLLLNVVAIVMGLLAYFFLAKVFEEGGMGGQARFPGGYFPFLVIGVSAFQFMNIALGSFSNGLRQQQQSGILDLLFLTRTPLRLSLVYGFLITLVYGAIQFIAYLLISRFAFSMMFPLGQLLKVLIILMVLGISLIPWAFLSAAFIIFFKKTDPMFLVLSGASSLLSGVYFPISVLPEKIQFFSKCLPLTFSTHVLRNLLISGQGFGELSEDLLGLAVLTLVLFPVAWGLLSWALFQSRRRGCLSV